MKKHPKQAFGIFHDGLVLRMVHLIREGNEVYLQAVDHTDLATYWYKIQDDPAEAAIELNNYEIDAPDEDALEINALESDFTADFQVQPGDRMLNSFDLPRGVIALNVHEENILKDAVGAISKKEINHFIKSKISPQQQRYKDYQSAIVSIGETKQHWLHHGPNLLLDMLQSHARINRRRLFFQLADANDIALTDYFRHCYEHDLGGHVMLVYLGQEYRKAFVFEQGQWQHTLKLQIAQSVPDEEIITSKLALAIDSAGTTEPERIILCGDMASTSLVEYMLGQFATVKVELLDFADIIISQTTEVVEDNSSLSKYALPIALAYKALFLQDNGFSHCNFLPSKIIEGQKQFKIAWHGILILILIFLTAISTTNLYLGRQQRLQNETHLGYELLQKLKEQQVEADRINQIISEIELMDKNLEAMGSILDGKNYWTQLLDSINTNFRAHPTSWLSNLKQEKDLLYLNGITSKRDNVIAIADALPQSKIQKVAHSKIRNHDVWNFEIVFAAPKLDWMAEVEQEMRSNLATITEQCSEAAQRRKSVVPAQSVSRAKPASSAAAEKVKIQKLHLAPLDASVCPMGTAEMLGLDTEVTMHYQSFMKAIQLGNMWEYRKQGYRFLSLYAAHPLAPIVRWWTAYRLYQDKEYALATQFLEDNLGASSEHHHVSLFLQARIYLAQGDRKYIELYQNLERELRGTALQKQVQADLAVIAKGGK